MRTKSSAERHHGTMMNYVLHVVEKCAPLAAAAFRMEMVSSAPGGGQEAHLRGGRWRTDLFNVVAVEWKGVGENSLYSVLAHHYTQKLSYDNDDFISPF